MKPRSPLGFVEALARRLARRKPPTPELPFRYVFIVAYGRSGSTVLQKILATIDGFHVTGENADALAGLFYSYRNARDAGHIDPEHDARALAQAFVEELIQPPARARMIGFNEVRSIDHLDDFDEYVGFIQMAFTPAFVVFNKREAAAVVQSGWWKDYPREPLIANIERFDALAAAYAARRPADTIVLDYDVFSRDASALRALFERLGVPFDASLVQRILDASLDP